MRMRMGLAGYKVPEDWEYDGMSESLDGSAWHEFFLRNWGTSELPYFPRVLIPPGTIGVVLETEIKRPWWKFWT